MEIGWERVLTYHFYSNHLVSYLVLPLVDHWRVSIADLVTGVETVLLDGFQGLQVWVIQVLVAPAIIKQRLVAGMDKLVVHRVHPFNLLLK